MDNELQNRKLIKKKLTWLLLFLGTAVAICVACIIYFAKRVPTWTEWQEKTIHTDEFGLSAYDLTLKNKRFTISDAEGKTVYTSEKEFLIQDIILSDIDENGDGELVTLVWKKGKFGNHKPFWVKTDEKSYSQHVFVYDLDKDGSVRQKWFASEIGMEVSRMKLMEKNNTIVLTETKDGRNLLWKWDSFGLKNIDNEVSFVAFGDNIIHEEIIEYAKNHEKGNYDFLYKPYKKEIESADIAAVNAETVLVDADNMVSGYPLFGSPKKVGEALIDAGFDIFACANNHVLDKGIGALEYTRGFYLDNGALPIGIQESKENEYRPYELIARNGITFALFSYTYGTNVGNTSAKYPCMIHYLPENEEQELELINDLKRSRKEADIIVVFVHWGNEYEKEISPQQRHFAKLFAKGGVDIVIGSHPHVVQEVETMIRPDGGEMTVYYSLGNFRAYQGLSEDTKVGAMADITVWHTYDGVKVKNCDIRMIDAYWRSKNH